MQTQTTYIVIPVFNEGKHIPKILGKLEQLPYPVIFVDDGSTDNTAALLPVGGRYTVVRHALNRGVGAATQTGFDAALRLGAEVVVTMDGDGQHAPEDVEALLTALKTKQVDIVIGSRFLKKTNKIPLLRRFYNGVGNWITFFLSGLLVTDSQSGFKAFTKKALGQIEIRSSGYEFCSEIIREISWFRLPYVEVPISVAYFDDAKGKGQSFANGMETVFKLLVRSLMR